MDEDVLDAAEFLLSRLTERSEVAHAEVGAVSCRRSDIVATHRRTRNATRVNETGVWCRVFADGAAGYRYVTVLEEDNLLDVVEKAIREGKYLGQDEADRFDVTTMHRDVHSGWAEERLDSVSLDEEIEPVERARDIATDGIDFERARFGYRSECLDEMIMSTAGSTIRTGIDRASIDFTLVPDTGQQIRRHTGTTAGPSLVDDLPSIVESAVFDAKQTNPKSQPPSSGESVPVVLGPKATGQLFQKLSVFLEMDTVYLGASPFEIGDRIGPNDLTVHDTVKPGSWAARAYDAECRPKTPTTLIDDGRVVRYLHSTATAALEDTIPAGNMLQPLHYDEPPRIHPGHLSVEPGMASVDGLLEDASLYVERFDREAVRNLPIRTDRPSRFPASPLYAKNVARQTPDDTDRERKKLQLPTSEAYVIEGGTRVGFAENVDIEFSIDDLHSIEAMSACRDTVTGVGTKFRSRFPFAVTAPAVKCHTRVVG